jgi:large subunit ribosomal protein L31
MKANIHPDWQDCKVTCACGNSFETKSSVATLQVDICSACHPFFTGEERFVDKEGRLDKFKNKMALSEKLRKELSLKRAAKRAKKQAEQAGSQERLSFKQVLNQAKHLSETGAAKEVKKKIKTEK